MKILQRKNWYVVVGTIGVVILVGFLGVMSSIAAKQAKLQITNEDQTEMEISDKRMKELEGFIWQSLQNDYGYDNDKVGIEAMVRPSSLKITEAEGIKNYEFLIDVDELKATYRVAFGFLGNGGFYEEPVVECPERWQMKYPEAMEFCGGVNDER